MLNALLMEDMLHAWIVLTCSPCFRVWENEGSVSHVDKGDKDYPTAKVFAPWVDEWQPEDGLLALIADQAAARSSWGERQRGVK